MSKLSKYYRKPELFIELPSKGFGYDLTNEELSILGEVGILPMTTLNRLTIENPEALVNGSAVEQLIKDCTTIGSVPIRNLYKCDIDAMIIAIRKVSQGDNISVRHACPKCEEESDYDISLQGILQKITYHDKLPYRFEIDEGLFMNILPTTFGQGIEVDNIFLQENKELLMMQSRLEEEVSADSIENDIGSSDERIAKFAQYAYGLQAKLTQTTINLYVQNIFSIDTPEETVTDKEDIFAYVSQLSHKQSEKMKDACLDINKLGVSRKHELTCPSCKEKFESLLELNPTDFFVGGSR